ncbi:MAG TPA: flagellar biosynthetic protein FliR [Alphaproteobacteria bacterium]
MLEQFLSAQLFTLFFVFVRIGSACAVLPGIGDAFVAMRIRLLLAGAISVVLAPVVETRVPALPDTPVALFLMIAVEIAVGVFIGLAARIALSAVQMAGMIIGFQTSLANAVAFDPSSVQQGAVTGAWLGSIALVLIFVTDLHHLMLRAVADSYVLFPPGGMPPVGDLADAVTRLVAASFSLGMRISAPFLIFGFIFTLALGLLARLMPQIQIFFIAMPLQIMLGLLVLGLGVGIGMTIFLGGFEEVVTPFIVGR